MSNIAMAGSPGFGSSMLPTATVGGADYQQVPALLTTMLRQLQVNNSQMKAYASRPIANDYLAQERQQQWVQHIRDEVGVAP